MTVHSSPAGEPAAGTGSATVASAPQAQAATQTSTQPQAHPAGSAQTRRPRIGFGRVLLTIVHLAALGVLGSIAFTLASALLSAGIGAIFAFGVGLVVLVGLVYLLFAYGWFEVERVRSLYGFNVGPLRLRRSGKPGFGGWLASLGRQSVDGRMWKALLSLGLGTLFGAIILRLTWGLIWTISLAVGGSNGAGIWMPWNVFGLDWVPGPGMLALAALLQLAAIVGLAAWHAVIARGLLSSPSRSELAAEVHTKSAQRAGAVRAAELERTRIERDLHDGVQPRLVSVGMTLGLAQQKIESDPEAAKQLIDEAHTSTKAAITELRQLARGIHASVLDDRGLDAALSALAGRSHVPVQLDVRMEGRPAQSEGVFRDAEAAVYFCIAEALTNAAKHSRASEVRVLVRLRDPGAPEARLWARVEDNGIGGATVQPGGGLDGISNRVLAAGGTFNLDSPQGGPTALEVIVPCAF